MKGYLFDIIKDIFLFVRKLIFKGLHDRKSLAAPLGHLGDWSSLTSCEYRTLRDLTDLWEEGHVDLDEGIEEDPAELMMSLALEMCGNTDSALIGLVKVMKLKDVGLYNRSKTFPPLSTVSGVACFVRAVTSDIRKLRWEHSQQDNLTQEERTELQVLHSNEDMFIKAADKGGKHCYDGSSGVPKDGFMDTQ